MREALLIIDVQNDYFTGGKCALYEPELALQAVKQLLHQCRKDEIPIYFIKHENDELATFFKPYTWGCEIHHDIKPRENERVIIKHQPNSFYETNLHEKLHEQDIQKLIVCGMMTHMCIDTTVRAAKDLGYSTTLLADACACKDLYWDHQLLPAPMVQQVYLSSLAGKFATIIDIKDFLDKRQRMI